MSTEQLNHAERRAVNERRRETAYRTLLVHRQYADSSETVTEDAITELIADLLDLADHDGYGDPFEIRRNAWRTYYDRRAEATP